MSMWWDISLQVLMFAISIGTYLYMNDYPKKLITRYTTYRNRHKHQARRHFVAAADLLSRARAHPTSPLAAAAAAEADKAVQLDPTDAANHIIRALAFNLQGFKTSALESFESALSPIAVGSLSGEEKADAMVKRAELRMEVSRVGGGGGEVVDVAVWGVVERELREAVALSKESGRGWFLLGECCEGLGKREEAKVAFEEAVRIEPSSVAAKRALERVCS